MVAIQNASEPSPSKTPEKSPNEDRRKSFGGRTRSLQKMGASVPGDFQIVCLS